MNRRGRAGYGAPPEPGCGAPFVPDAEGFDANARDGYGPPPRGYGAPPPQVAAQARPRAPEPPPPIAGASDAYAPASAPVGQDFEPPPAGLQAPPSMRGFALVALAIVLVPFASCAGCTCAAASLSSLHHAPAQQAPARCK